MLKHILITFYRSALTSKFQLATIIFGLTMGIVVSLLIYIYVQEESGYDRHHAYADRIYRVNTTLEMEGKVDATAKAGLNTGEALMDFYPEIEEFTQLLNVNKQTIKIDADLYSSEKVVYADSTFFTFLSYSFLAGYPHEALVGPNKAVISKTCAIQYFGSIERAFGNTIKINNADFQINGIYDASTASHIPYEIFLSLSSLPKSFIEERNRDYMWLTSYTYIRVKAGVKMDELELKFKSFNEKHLVPFVAKNRVNGSITHHLEPITHIHLNDKLRFDFPGAINPQYLAIFSASALLTLFIALINYVNLTTAQISKRLKEIGIKKSLGATKKTLLLQFLAETMMTVCFSFLVALVLLYFTLPQLNKLTDKAFSFLQIITPSFLVASCLFILLFGILAGVYPAILLSA